MCRQLGMITQPADAVDPERDCLDLIILAWWRAKDLTVLIDEHFV